MAGSFQHCIREDGSFRGVDLIGDLGDAYEALEEMYDMIVHLSGGDPRRIHEAWRDGHYRNRMPERVDEEPEAFAFRAFWADGEPPPRIDPYRGTGRTSRQMKRAPRGAVYVWHSDRLQDARAFAARLGREDLKMVAPSWLTDRRWMGIRAPALIVDHAARLTEEQRDILGYVRQAILR